MVLSSDEEMDAEIETAPLSISSKASTPAPINATGSTSAVAMEVDEDEKPNISDVKPPVLKEAGWKLPPNLIDEDDDDEIIATLPVYVSHSLSSSLHLFQYPLQVGNAPSLNRWAREHEEVITARMKEQVKRFELEIPVDMREPVWNDERAEEMGFVKEKVRNKAKGKEKEPEKWGTKVRLRSEEVPEVTGYWSGIVHDDALHLQPIPHLYQLRPSLHYLDVAEALIRAKEEKTRKEKAGEDRDDDIDADVKGGKTEKVEEVQLSAVVAQANNRESNAHLDRQRTKMGTAGTVGSTEEIKSGIVGRAQREVSDQWVPWEWEDEPDQVIGVLNNLIVAPNRRANLQCLTKPLDVISKKSIGKGALLPN